MAFKKKLSPYATAQLLLLNAAYYETEKSKDVSRYRFSREMLRRVSGWGRLSSPFIQELDADLRRLGWLLIDLSDSEFAIIVTTKIAVWPKLSTKRLATAGLLNTSDEDEIDEAYSTEFPEALAEIDTEE
jgi:hypothetical protein